MDKRLTRSDFVFILVFIFMLILALGAFFYGMKLGTDRSDAKYAEIIKKQDEASKGLPSYDQSYLVSFYHTVYLPFREFNLKWEESMDEIENQSGDSSSILKQLSKLASEKYDAVANQSMPQTSPLLQEGQQNYLKSLKLFSQAAGSMQSKANNMSPSVLLTEIGKDAYFTEAKNFALQAQKNYYDSIVAWNQSVDQGAKGLDAVKNPAISLNEWSQLSLNLKDSLIASVLAGNKLFYAFTPQDAALRVDELIKSGQAKKLNANNVPQIMDILIGTQAIRPGDFVKGKAKFYADETLPQLPFFSKMD